MESAPISKLPWPTKKEESARLREQQVRAFQESITSPGQNWLAKKLITSGHQWTRKSLWGYRIFDFWSHELGIAVMLDTDDSPNMEAEDECNFRRSGIIVLHVRSMNGEDAEKAMKTIAETDTWSARRLFLGLRKPNSKDRHSRKNESAGA